MPRRQPQLPSSKLHSSRRDPAVKQPTQPYERAWPTFLQVKVIEEAGQGPAQQLEVKVPASSDRAPQPITLDHGVFAVLVLLKVNERAKQNPVQHLGLGVPASSLLASCTTNER